MAFLSTISWSAGWGTRCINQLSKVKNDFTVQQPQTIGLALSAQIYSKSGLFMGEDGICIPKLKKNPSLTLGMMIINIKAMSLTVAELSSV